MCLIFFAIIGVAVVVTVLCGIVAVWPIWFIAAGVIGLIKWFSK